MSLGVLVRLTQVSMVGAGVYFGAKTAIKYNDDRLLHLSQMEKQRKDLLREMKDLEEVLKEHSITETPPTPETTSV